MKEITVKPPFIKLDSFLKLSGDVLSGGEAKEMVSEGKIKVNGEVCTMRGKKLYDGYTVDGCTDSYTVKISEDN